MFLRGLLALASMPGMDGGEPTTGAGVAGKAFALASMPGIEGGGSPGVCPARPGSRVAGAVVALGPLAKGGKLGLAGGRRDALAPMPGLATGGLSGVANPVPPAKAAVPFAGTSTPAG